MRIREYWGFVAWIETVPNGFFDFQKFPREAFGRRKSDKGAAQAGERGSSTDYTLPLHEREDGALGPT